MPRDGRRRFPAKLQSSVGGRIDLGSFCSPGNVRPADEQGLVPKRIGDLDPDFPAPGADVHDEAKGLVPENLGVPRDGRLGGRGPRSNPMLRGRKRDGKRRDEEHVVTMMVDGATERRARVNIQCRVVPARIS